MQLNVVLMLATISSSYGYHILVLTPAPSHNHNTLGKGIVDALLNGGHTVTWATPYPEKVKNPPKTLHILDISTVHRFIAALEMGGPKKTKLPFIKEFSQNVSLEMINTPSVKEALIKQQFDAVVTETFFCDFLAGVAAIQQAPWIVLEATQMYPQLEAQVDEVRSIATIPLIHNPSDTPMPFNERVVNLIMYIWLTVIEWLDRPKTIRLYENTFGPLAAARGLTLPPFDDAFYNVSIMFVNSHESVTPAFSTPPNVVNIAGYHMDENIPPLPKDLQDLLDGSPQGVVYFNMGPNWSAALIPPLRSELLQLFSTLPYTVLWKSEELLTGLPPNVHVWPLLPQLSILAHENTKVFITHVDHLSTLEAVRAGVPVVAVGVFGDQPSNADRATEHGYAFMVNLRLDMVPQLEVALNEMLNNDKYSKQAKYFSRLFQYRPTTPKQLINHYVTLAIETKGAYHLRSLSLKYSWYERWMLDVVLFLLTVNAVVIVLSAYMTIIIMRIRGKNDFQRKSL